MYQMLLNLWITHRATEVTLGNAVTKGWITADQEQLILATPQNPA